MAAKSHRTGSSRKHPTLCAPSLLHLCSTFVSIVPVQGTETMDGSILHPCSACVGRTTLSAVEMSMAEHPPCLGGGERKTFPYFVGLLDFKLACEMQGLSGRSPGGSREREKAENMGVEDRSVVLRLFCGRGIAQPSSCERVMASNLSGDRSEEVASAHRAPSSSAATHPSPGPDPEHCSSEARYPVPAAAHGARGCQVQDGPASSGGL